MKLLAENKRKHHCH